MLARAGIAPARQRLERAVDARYARQSYELTVPVPDPPYGADVMEHIAEAFHDRHGQTYGHQNRGEPVQMVNVRLSAIGEIPAIRIRQETGTGGAPTGHRPIWLRGSGEARAAVYRREDLRAGFVADGPGVVESLESTVLVRPGWSMRMDSDGFLHLTRGAGG